MQGTSRADVGSRLIAWMLDRLADTQPPEVNWALALYDERRRTPSPPRAQAFRRGSGLLAVAMLFGVGCGNGSAASTSPGGSPVRVDGSSTVYLVSKAMGEEVGRTETKVIVNESGTTGGFKKFCRGETDVSGASRPIQQDEIDACKAAGIDFIELPIGYDGLAIVVNRANDWADHITVAELRRMWAPEATNTITAWKQVRDTFPDRPLHLFGPGGDSGTFDYFTQAIVGKQRASRTDYTGSEDDSVLVRGVIADANALGYFGYAYIRKQDQLRAVPVDDGDPANGDGPIAPSVATVADGTYQPLSRPIFIYVSVPALKRPEVDKFVTFYLNAARELSADVGYVPLRLHTDQLAQERYKARKTGSIFSGGAPTIGVTMEKLLEAQTR